MRLSLLPILLAAASIAAGGILGTGARAQETEPDPPEATGVWSGELAVPNGSLYLMFRIWKNDDGSLTGRLDVPEQSSNDLPLTSVHTANGTVTFRYAPTDITFTGRLSADGRGLTGSFRQAGMTIPLRLGRIERDPRLRRPQDPVGPFPYDEEEVAFASGEVTLHGTLTLPRSGGPFPAALLLAGSGANNRDEEIYGHRPFRLLADVLARLGFAVLRVDERGAGRSTGSSADSTLDDFARDARAAVDLLKSRPGIAPRAIGLIGHSEGGYVGSIVAAGSADIGFLVLLAGPGIPGEQLLYLQGEKIMRAAGAPEAVIAANRRLQEILFGAIRENDDPADWEREIRAGIAGWKGDVDPAIVEALGANAPGFADRQIASVTPAWFRSFLRFDPRPALEKVRAPVLALIGERDVQVPPAENLAGLEAALSAGGNPGVTARELPRLNHLFQTSVTGGLGEYARIDETIAPIALEAVSGWLLGHAGTPGDLDLNGRIAVADAQIALRLAVGLLPAPLPAQLRRGDVSPARADGTAGDGAVTVADALRILRRAVGLE